MDIEPSLHCANRDEWRAWLQANHDRCEEVWLLYFKKHTGKPSVTYDESLEEALCFAWIDGLRRRVDDDRYAQRFTPRRPGSRWSPRNIALAEQLIKSGRMTSAGMAAFENRSEYDPDFNRRRSERDAEAPEDFLATLRDCPDAHRFFDAMAPGYQRRYLLWITSAKREQTRKNRIEKVISMLRKNQKPGQM